MADVIPASHRLAERQTALQGEIEQAENECAVLRLDVEDNVKGADKKLETARSQLRALREELNEVDRALPIARQREEAASRREAKKRGRQHAQAALECNHRRTDTAVRLSKTLDQVAGMIRSLHQDSAALWNECREAFREGEVLSINEFGATTPSFDPFPSATFERAFVGVPFQWLGYSTRWPFERGSGEVSNDPKAALSLAEYAKAVGASNELIIKTAIELANDDIGEE